MAIVLTAPRASYAEVVLASNPVAFWEMAESGSTMQDSSGNNKTLEYFNAPLSGITGPFPGSSGREFDGSSNYAVGLPHLGGGNIPAYTMEFWFKSLDAGATIPAVQVIIGQWNADNPSNTNVVMSMRTDRTVTMDEFPPSAQEFNLAGNPLVYNTWHHIVFVKHSAITQRDIYFDGAKFSVASKENSQTQSMVEFILGATTLDGANYTSPIHAQMSNISIYDYELTATDVADRRTAAGF